LTGVVATMKYMKRKYAGHRRYDQEWRTAVEAYRARYQSIVNQLRETTQLFEDHNKRHPLHDAAVDSISRVDRETLHVELDDRRLEFRGVKDCRHPDPVPDGAVWQHDEMDLADPGHFELRALFSEGDFRVIAREVHVFDKNLKRYVVPERPAPPQPTLFLDCKHQRRPHKK
jgi:Protein of unknown function (DUF4085)